MAGREIRCADYKLPGRRVVRARYKSATKNGNSYWRAAPQDDDLVFVINKGGIPKIGRGKGRNPYAIYPRYHESTVKKIKPALKREAARVGIVHPKTRAKEDLEWDGGTLTGAESGTPLPDKREWVRHPLTNEQARTYLVIGKIIK